ncbi:signal peptidase II [Sandaracinobacter sp.]|uniref:signal peptidase II n=1 Tax=Sandaracinobacter sp. TaxID=2487581 RepID=UPI0035AFB457
MRRLAYALAAIVFLADQLVKYWIIHVVELEQKVSVPVLPFFSLTWVENRGVSMGMLTADTDVGRWLLVGLTGVIATVVAVWIRRERHWPESLALGLILGGALGNIVDRVRFGYVVDFVHLHWGPWSFYVFNIADAAITAGVVILLFRALIGRSDASSERLPNA